MAIGILKAGVNANDVTASTGKDVADTVNSLLGSAVVWLGIDSLTDGSGGFSYNVVLEKMARGVVSWGGRWVPFSDPTTWGEYTIFKSGTTNIAGLAYSDSRRARSLDGRGFYAAAGSDSTYLVEPAFNWAYADVYYLQQPSGGSFQLDRPSGQTAVSVNTDGALSIQKVRITKNLKNGPSAANDGKNGIRVRQNPVAAEIVCYGIVFYSGDAGPVFINAAQGGRKVTEQLVFDSAFQQSWFSQLGVTHAVINAGMNDRTISDAATFQADMLSMCQRFPSGTNFVIVRPNNPSDSLIDAYDAVYPAVATQLSGNYLDTKASYGDYASFTGRGWMTDTVHPNQHYQFRNAQDVCRALFGKSRYENTPAVINYVGGDPQ